MAVFYASISHRLRRGTLRAWAVVLKWKGMTRSRPRTHTYLLFTLQVMLIDSNQRGVEYCTHGSHSLAAGRFQADREIIERGCHQSRSH